MFLPWRDHSFLFDEDDVGKGKNGLFWIQRTNGNIENYSNSALNAEINADTEPVTGIQFIETGHETFREEMHYFDNIAPSDDIPNHLLFLYLNTGLFLMTTGILMIVKNQSILIFCGCLEFFGSFNIILQARLVNDILF